MTNPYLEDFNLHTIEIEIKDLYNQIEKLYQELDNVNHKYARLIASQITKHPKK